MTESMESFKLAYYCVQYMLRTEKSASSARLHIRPWLVTQPQKSHKSKGYPKDRKRHILFPIFSTFEDSPKIQQSDEIQKCMYQEYEGYIIRFVVVKCQKRAKIWDRPTFRSIDTNNNKYHVLNHALIIRKWFVTLHLGTDLVRRVKRKPVIKSTQGPKQSTHRQYNLKYT